MRVPLSWLREVVAFKGDAKGAAEVLIAAGVGVDAIEGDVLTLEVTSNRSDLLSIVGIAREMSLLRGLALQVPVPSLREFGAPLEIKVEVPNSSLCPRYTARVVRDVNVGPTPVWMQEKLKAALGENYVSINNVADITNYVMLEFGEPLHAFDLRHLRGNRIVVRPARAGECMMAINGREYTLEASDLVIADAERPVAIAGVMGGKESEISSSTRDVLIEAAIFDAVSVRRTSRRLGLASESSYRFERGVDWETVERASCRAAQLIAELAGGRVAQGFVDVAVPRVEKKPCALRFERVRKVLGMEVAPERIRAIVEGLGGRVRASDAQHLEVVPPAHRRDLNIEVDFIEEIARVEGYDKIPTDMELGLSVAADTREDVLRDRVRATLTAMGAFEVLTWSFEEATAAPEVRFWSAEKLLPLRNPKGHVDRTLRSALGPALIKVFRTNVGCGELLHPIFEIANVYFRCAAEDIPTERTVLGIEHPGGIAELRAMVRGLLERLQIPYEAQPLEASWLESGEALTLGGERAGYLGRCQSYAVAEIDFERLVASARLVRKAKAYSMHPAVYRDVAMVFPKSVMWPAIEACICGLGIPILQGISYLNHFEGKGIPEGRRSVAVSLTFLAADRTLTGSEVEKAVEQGVAALGATLGGVLR